MIEIIPLHLQIRAKRREKNLSQLQLSAQAQVSLNFISRLEQGRNSNMYLDNLRRISKALDYYDWDLNLSGIQL